MKLSIITINLNNANGLRKTIESIVSQMFIDFEYIIIDGASTDGSTNVINEYSDKITYWISEPDKGIYNAMNKGVKVAKGEYCLFLNSGDWLVDENVVRDFCNLELNDDVISGNIFIIENTKKNLHQSPTDEDFSFRCFYGGSLPHPASFIKRELFNQYGLYNEDNRIVSDKEFFLKVFIVNCCSYAHFDRIIACFNLLGISSQKEWSVIHNKETDEVLSKILHPLVYKGFSQLVEENIQLQSHEIKYQEYMNLINGRTSFVIKSLLWLKGLKKIIKRKVCIKLQ